MSSEDVSLSGGPGGGFRLDRNLLLWGFAIAALLVAASALKSILTPFAAGAVLGYLLNPVAERLQRLGLSRLGAALLLLAVFVLVVGAALLLLVPVLIQQFEGFLTGLPSLIAALRRLFAEWSDKLVTDYSKVLKEHGLDIAIPTLDTQKYVDEFFGDTPAHLADLARSMLSRGLAIINILSVIVVTPVVAFYMLLDWGAMVRMLDDLTPPRYRGEVRMLAREIDAAMGGFLRGQAAVCFFLGSWFAFGLSFIGLNFGFLIGVVAGVLSFIPFAGSIAAFVLSISIGLVQSWPDLRLPLEAVAIVSVGLFLDGNVLSPRLVGASIGLHPVWLMFALFAFGTLFGFVGLLLAAPAAAAAGVLLRFALKRYRESSYYLRPSAAPSQAE
ncbi:AI-2E family transporter [Methylocystis bryophila]|uniref:AI-2E family transporter n=1 Tax=Methylocystis bryophila TaxID=655015 RepID=A0A1W6MWI7_9HYPH|nr:AI-2E family transporter [Methylocystis bryophila]ARN81953.1 AI-2E family transporter [Methylocystis bryophila]BDV38048.1 AI-2E family transporter [Methylocystis bryophila]